MDFVQGRAIRRDARHVLRNQDQNTVENDGTLGVKDGGKKS